MMQSYMTRLQTIESFETDRDTSSVPLLITMLNDEDAVLRLAAIHALGTLADTRAIAPLVGVLRSGKREMSGMAARALSRIGSAAVPSLIGVLWDSVDNEWIGEPVARALGHIGDVRAIPVLVDALRSPVFEVANAAGQALGRIGAAALAPLLAVLGDDTSNASWHAMHGLRCLGEATVPPLLDVLSTGNALARQRAIEALSLIDGERAKEAFVLALNDGEPQVRQEAAIALSRSGDARGMHLLIEALSTKGRYRATTEMDALEHVGEPAFEPLRAIVRDETQTAVFRYHALLVLGKLTNDAVIPLLVTMLHDGTALVRQGAVESLRSRKYDDPQYIQTLLAMLDDESPDVRIVVMSTSGYLRVKSAIEPLVANLEAVMNAGNDGNVKDTRNRQNEVREQMTLVSALGHFHDERVLALLDQLVRSYRPGLSRQAAHVLRDSGETGLALLFAALRDEQESVRANVVQSLAYLQDASVHVVPLLGDALNDRSAKVRREAASALGHVKNDTHKAIEWLLIALNDEDETVRTYAAQSLGQIGDERAIPALVQLQHVTPAKAPVFGVKEACIAAIMHIKHWWDE